jgi:hypothetical protein
MKKGIVLTVALVILGFLAFMATNLVRNSGKSDTELLEFSIKDTARVDRILLEDAYNNKMELVRNEGGEWTDKDGNCLTQEPVNTMLETFVNIEFKGYIPESSRKNVLKRMSSMHIKVQIFQDGEWVKTWFVGSGTQDHYGTYMLLETPDEKSDLPVIMRVKGLNGIIEPRFFADARRWKCTKIFSLERDEISKVDVRFYDDPTRSFTVGKTGNNYSVKHMGKSLDAVDTNMVIRYLNNYRKIHFEGVNYELSDKQIDSLKRKQPFCVLSVTTTDGQTEKLRMFRMKSPEGGVDDMGNEVPYDVNRFWCALPSGEVVKCQYFVFNPLIMGHIYFDSESAAASQINSPAFKK